MFKAQHVHFIGIGGIGVSAVAKMFLRRNADVSGSDINQSPVIDELKKIGAHVSLGHGVDNISAKCDLVVYTNALLKDNVELIEARKRGISTLSYPEVLGEISREKFTIAISGNAGKTTTTAMIGQILINAGLEPTIIVGSLANFTDKKGNIMRTNFVSGDGEYFVVEADEYKKAFLNLEPKIIAITNIEEDHLDYYKSLIDIQSAFAELANKVPEGGFIICSAKDKNVLPVLDSVRATVLNYPDTLISNYPISIPGEHNRDNAKVAATVALVLGIGEKIIETSLRNFKGAWRRFEYKGETRGGALLYDDYAHNPQKIKAVIAGTKEKFTEKRIIIIFQPHLFSRTKQMLKELAKSFLGADRVIVMPIYAARERVDSSITHRALADAIVVSGTVPQVEVADSLDEAALMLESEGKETVCLTVGAGDVYTMADKILNL